MELDEVKYNCKYFKGEIPCLPNKLRGKVCKTCDEYTPISKKILIIKLGALGDVIRTTPLVVRFRNMYPNCHITWVTLSPEILPKQHIDKIYKFGFEAVYAISHQFFDIAINLDKEIEACSLLHDVQAYEKFGFVWHKHRIDAATLWLCINCLLVFLIIIHRPIPKVIYRRSSKYADWSLPMSLI